MESGDERGRRGSGRGRGWQGDRVEDGVKGSSPRQFVVKSELIF